MKILITGGAGYIGSHVVKLLGETTPHELVIIDNLSTGNKDAILYGRFIHLDLSDFAAVEEVLAHERFDAIIHFAASIVVPESVQNPLKYYMNNTVNTTNLIRAAIASGVKYFIFSSTAAVYGEPSTGVVSEESPTEPINPYGMSKLMSETILRDAAKAHPGFRFVILRYFNVAGASLDNRIGQSFPNATHLVKIAAECAAGKRAKMSIFGEDYPTRDGTCIRDYIHVEDLASAHLAALEYLEANGASNIFNCGYGYGFTVKEVIATMKEVSGVDFVVESAPRRAGDPAQLIADNRRILATLPWRPRHDDLRTICATALAWEKKLLEQGR
ncbi:MAG: UDP-glucose 4-epimerase GalE [Campylobacterales bacterium]